MTTILTHGSFHPTSKNNTHIYILLIQFTTVIKGLRISHAKKGLHMERISRKQLYSMIDTLNHIKPMTDAKFGLNIAYGGYRLVKRSNASGGESDLTYRVTARELYNIMLGIENFNRA